MEEKKTTKSFDVKAKAEQIKKSNMSESEKKRYLIQLGIEEDGAKVEKAVPFSIYATVKKIPQGLRGAMQVYPAAKGVEKASLKQWDEIYKDF